MPFSFPKEEREGDKEKRRKEVIYFLLLSRGQTMTNTGIRCCFYCCCLTFLRGGLIKFMREPPTLSAE